MGHTDMHLPQRIRTRDGAGHIMGEVLIAMVLPLAFAVYNFVGHTDMHLPQRMQAG